MRFSLIIVCLTLFTSLYSQNNNLPAENEIYAFLKYLSVRSVISNYDDLILPKTKQQIWNYLTEAENNNILSDSEREIIKKAKAKLFFTSDSISTNIFEDFQNSFSDSSIVHFYSYNNTLTNFIAKPVMENSFIYSKFDHASSNLLSLGVKIEGNYENWFGFAFLATNGFQYGNRNVALNDHKVKQSFTFNNTKLDNFDYTEGHFNVNYKQLSFELGRERILWGRGEEKLILSNNPQVFDFIKFSAHFKYFSFDHLHGWLVQPSFSTFDTLINYQVKNKNSKYIAISRFGINPLNSLSFGVTQSIIYANRSFELAYLNPFLFLESAQRSLNDLDNSFLGFDIKFAPFAGISLASIINFDDLNFRTLGSEGFGSIQNRFSWHINLNAAYPFMFQNMLFTIDFLEFRPYMYTHFGSGESSLYSNNGFFMGPEMEPNSYKLSLKVKYFVSKTFNFSTGFAHYEHGSNIYDFNGNLFRNVGGNFNEFIRLQDSRITQLLDGNLEVKNSFSLSLNYELINDCVISFDYNGNTGTTGNKNFFILSLKLNSF